MINRYILAIIVLVMLAGCSITRYVPQDSSLLKRNYVLGKNGKKSFKTPDISPEILSSYIGYKPNRSLLGIKFSLRFYNLADTSKHGWVQNVLTKKIGSPPVILDSALVAETNNKMNIYLRSCGYLNSSVSDSIVIKKRSAKIYYIVDPGEPYTIAKFDRKIEDTFIREVLASDSVHSLIKIGDNFNTNKFDAERNRITTELQQIGFYSFRRGNIRYMVDSARKDNTVSVDLDLNMKVKSYDASGDPEYETHPIYSISRIIINTNFDDPATRIGQNYTVKYDTLTYKGLEIVYSDRLEIRADVLAAAVTFSPRSIYDPKAIEKSIQNIRDLGFNTRYLLNEVTDTVEIQNRSLSTAQGVDVQTSERMLECVILCTPFKKQSSTQDLEASMTSTYSSLALTLGYQNRNLFRGAETFAASVRGAYEIMHDRSLRNSYELGLTTSISVPRFVALTGVLRSANIRQKSTKLQLNYNIQERPYYHRTVLGASYGFNWTGRNGGRVTINPVDISIVNVPWIDSTFQAGKSGNIFLANSYTSQVIAGLLAGYYYSSNHNYRYSGHTVRFLADVNGNLLSLFNNAMPTASLDRHTYHTIGGQRYAQFARASFEYAGRATFNPTVQAAWRFYLGVAVPYGNSSQIPFDRQYYAGGSSSMRGWQIRSLGLGGATSDSTNFVLGDMRLEGNVELRFNINDWLNMATFVDVGNVWMNSEQRTSDEQMFRFNTFYQQLAMNTGLGLRFDFNVVQVRFDWGIKMRNPNRPRGDQWFRETGISNTVFHFAVGLPF